MVSGKRGQWVQGISVCAISTYKQVKFLGKSLQHCCSNSFSFLKGSGRGIRGSKGGHYTMIYGYGYQY